MTKRRMDDPHARREVVRPPFTRIAPKLAPPRRSGVPGGETSPKPGRSRPGPAIDKPACSTSLFAMKSGSTSVGAFAAKNTFSELLERVARGAEITITKRNRPIARLVPAATSSVKERRKAVAALAAMRRRYSLRGVSIKELVAEGRR